MNKNLFEEYLQAKFFEDYNGHKDDYEEAFDSFLSSLDGEDYIEYGNKFLQDTLEYVGMKVQKYTDPKPEYSGITWNTITSEIKM